MYKFAKFLRWILLKMPLSICFLLGNLVGFIIYCSGKKRKIAFRNIKMAFPQKTRKEIKKILKESFNNFGISIISALIFPRIFKYIEIIGEEKLSPAGGIMLCIHDGNWELYNARFAKAHHQTVLVNEQRQKGLDRLLNEIRQESRVYTSTSLRKLIESLEQGNFVGLVADHGPEENALAIEFFSHLVPTPRGSVYLAKKLNKKIYPTFGYRKKGFSVIAEINGPVEPQGEDEEILQRINKIYEEYLTKYPSQYVWSFKRFKRKKDLNILILSDSKAGHLKQSKALAAIFAEEDFLVRSKIIEVRYRNKFSKMLTFLCALFCTNQCCGCGACFFYFLDKNTKAELEGIYADIVISTGSFCAPLNKLFSSYLGAKSINILKANMPLNKFDLSIVPEHDRVISSSAVLIKGALSEAKIPQEKVEECKSFFCLSEDKKVSFFIGGPLWDKKQFIENLSIFSQNLKKFSLERAYKILISTSRRTPKIIEDFLEKEFSNFKNTEAIVYANRLNYDFVFDGFIGLCEMIFVSSESISMISEIASLKKPCVALVLENPDDKHAVFLRSMGEEINCLKSPYCLDDLRMRTSSIFEENRKIVKQAIQKLL